MLRCSLITDSTGQTPDNCLLCDRSRPQQLRSSPRYAAPGSTPTAPRPVSHVHRPSPMPCLASISEVAAGTVLRNGFNALRPLLLPSARPVPSRRVQLFRQFVFAPVCSTVAEILSTSPDKRCPAAHPARLSVFSSRGALRLSSRSAISLSSVSISSFPVRWSMRISSCLAAITSSRNGQCNQVLALSSQGIRYH